jgi:hypothetical protein
MVDPDRIDRMFALPVHARDHGLVDIVPYDRKKDRIVELPNATDQQWAEAALAGCTVRREENDDGRRRYPWRAYDQDGKMISVYYTEREAWCACYHNLHGHEISARRRSPHLLRVGLRPPQQQAEELQTMANIPTFQDLVDAATQLGAEAGKGKDTQVKFLLKTVEGGYHNILDLNHNKHGTDVDDATKLAETYVKAQQGSVVFDAKAPNQRKLVSCLRTGIKLGAWPNGGNGEPIATVNKLMSRRQKLKQNPATAKRLNDAANSLLSFARAQLKRDTLIPEDDFDEYLFKPQQEAATAEEIIASTVKKLDKLIDGSASHGTAQCNTPHIVNARNNLRQELAAIAIAKARAPAPGQPAKVV